MEQDIELEQNEDDDIELEQDVDELISENDFNEL